MEIRIKPAANDDIIPLPVYSLPLRRAVRGHGFFRVCCDVRHLITIIFCLLISVVTISCSQEKEHTAPAINPKDSVAVMTTYGVNTLISDSGVIKYRIITEQWEVNPNTNPSKWLFTKGLHLQQFDQKLHVQAHIEADTAYYYDTKRLWELRGRVRIHTKNQLQFKSEELFWDENQHQLYSNKFSQLNTPERQLQGTHFVSNEQMTKYHVTNTKAAFERGDIDSKPAVSEEGSGEEMISRPPKQPMPLTR